VSGKTEDRRRRTEDRRRASGNQVAGEQENQVIRKSGSRGAGEQENRRTGEQVVRWRGDLIEDLDPSTAMFIRREMLF